MNQNKYVLALDVGDRRIGVALASQLARLPAPLVTLDRTKITEIYDNIDQLVRNQNVAVVVVGLPRGLHGQETQQTIIARKFAADLSHKLNIPVVMQDEAGTSIEAERLLKARGKSYEKADIDSEAASLILRDYLNQTAGYTA
ncbi:MAG: Holliday junction resolvase RuvX [bacterium]|nr:Holliday junction resolvase RuvX [bacterium]